MATIEQILGTDSGKVAFEKTDRNIVKLNNEKLDTVIFKSNQSLTQQLSFGYYRFYNATDGFPTGYTTDNDFILFVASITTGLNDAWQRLMLFDVRSEKVFTQRRNGGVLYGWNEITTSDRTTLTLLNGWTPWAGTAYPPKAIRNGNTVLVVGAMQGGTATSGTVAFNLPSGFRSVRDECCIISGNDGKLYNLVVRTSGDCTLDVSWGTGWTSALKLLNFSFEC